MKRFDFIEKAILFLLALSFTALIGMMINHGFAVRKVMEEPSENQLPRFKVEIRGEVKNPGVYSVTEGSRVCDVIYAAGGITKKACVENIDLGAVVVSKTVIEIPKSTENNGIMPAININTADKDTLCLIPGIGSILSERIIEYRQKNGDFKDISEINRVNGIGEKIYQEIKEYIITEETQK